jgi:hypothetical protein
MGVSSLLVISNISGSGLWFCSGQDRKSLKNLHIKKLLSLGFKTCVNGLQPEDMSANW